MARRGDLRRPGTVPGLRGTTLDGALFANALHFDPAPGRTLGLYGTCVRSGGRLVVVEYDGRPASPWVPHPLPVARLRDAAAEAGFGPPELMGERPSAYGGRIYCARLTVV
ncbi:MAG: hypothetical protein GWM90_21845 [Gemmatimonadetes bacterium]|nr:hypothetical protein [Gemmatimonadota bacterium]NIQ57215.1 hypothetical protein [Gemmatimonadota bacterium]NIU77386.1 hypothetical protein [Gammaproteobacteria bacterium]NIX46628.1 hypothetical protein [Gemmatimonadota bacterium]NIY10969.1 hypothetical protein [Gemmatimonadota bacterium]